MPRHHLKIKSRRCVVRTLEANGYKLQPGDDEFNFKVCKGGSKFKVLAYGRCILWAKGRRNLHIAFCDAPGSKNCNVYMYPHDELLKPFLKMKVGKNAHPKDWGDGYRSWRKLTRKLRELLEPYRIPPRTPKE